MNEKIDKQAIEEMAEIMCEDCKSHFPKCQHRVCGAVLQQAEALYNAGYRKQVEGVWTFNRDGSGTCSNCHFTQKGVWDYDNHQHFCGVCGAKMKGGE